MDRAQGGADGASGHAGRTDAEANVSVRARRRERDPRSRKRAGPDGATLFLLRWLEPAARRQLRGLPQLSGKLERAGNPLVPVAFVAQVQGWTAACAVAAALPLAVALVAAGGWQGLGARLGIPLALLPALAGLMAYSFLMLRPDLEIASRRRNLEGHLPHALNFMAALASAGVVPVEVFGSLGQQRVYGEVSKEAAKVYRDAQLFSKDLVAALQAAARRSPSQQWEEFLQGSVNTVTSGGNLTAFLMAKSEQFSQENRRKQKAFLESLGVMAESYVVVAAAAPLFLIVILSVMTLLEKGSDPTFLLNIIVLLALPVIHGMFTYILRTMRPD
ncbi:MAG TPA: type II secretion system F family protein [Candidatus Thermoplasmatota archaeon]|nr:type II secretion system F family protein [Candidatus Thermoplasmatota archaeon]